MTGRSGGKPPAPGDHPKRPAAATRAVGADPESNVAEGRPQRSARARRLTTPPTIWFIVAGLAVAIIAGIAWAWSRQQFAMVKTLALIAEREGAWDNPWDLQEKKVASLQTNLRTETDPIKRLILRRELAQQYIAGGTSEGAIAILEALLSEYGPSVPKQDIETLKADLALAYFRLGELRNCTWNHNSDACILPVQAEGVHKEQFGAAEAAKRYGELLADPKTDPENALVYRWLLNISYMVLGKYPDGVPKQWLIPLETFASDYDIGKFRDVAATRGLTVFGRAGGVILDDFDNDGHLDLMISHMGLEEQLEYFHNDGDGNFTPMTEKAGLKGIVGGLNIVQADYNNDGCIDVFIPRGAWLHDKGQYPSSLLRNNCDGTFTDVTAKAGLLNNYPTQTAVWADFNNDGLLDLFVGNEIVRDKVAWPESARNFRLYINNGDGTFTDVGPESGINVSGMIKGATLAGSPSAMAPTPAGTNVSGMVKGATADDYDNDGWPDLYVSVMGGPNHLFRNVGAKGKIAKFVDVTREAGVAEPITSFTCWFFDYNNDGWPDIFVSGYWATMPNIVREYLGQKGKAKGARPQLYRNNKDGTFTDVSREAHLDRLLLTMGANFGDLDNDGWLDFYVGTGAAPLTNIVPNQMFRNHGGQYFQNVTTSGGFGHLQKGHGVAFGDIDNSGNQDVFAVIGGAYTADRFWSALFKNPGHGNHWIKLNLIGTRANRFAVGARIRVRISEEGKTREIFGTVNSGGSFGASSLRPHIGLGKAAVVDQIEIRWPGSGLVQRFDGPIAADRPYEIREDRPALSEVTRLRQNATVTARTPALVGEDREWTVRGVVRSVIPESNVLLVTHEELPGLMPSMTMGFRTTNSKLYEGLQAGDVIRFTLKGIPPNVTIVAITREGRS
jgi:Cu/Ag efflux protein CusF